MKAGNTAERKLNICFCAGFWLGILCFVVIYGFAVLNLNADGWVFKSDNDLRQHYVGFMAYRDSEWQFPLGMTDKLSSPYEMSIVYTDSIPLVAFVCKLMAPILPRPFQYFGWFALFSFGLTGGFGAKLIGRLLMGDFNKDDSKCMLYFTSGLGALFFVLSFVMLQRTFYHTSLTAQWIVLLCFDLWFAGLAHKSLCERLITYGLMGLLCAGIHTYFLPMAMAILFGSSLEYIINEKIVKKNIINFRYIIEALLSLVVMGICAGGFLYVFGAFAGESKGEYWVGDFTMNINSFFNSMGKSRIFKELPTYGPMQFEGAAFLGAGIWGLIVLLIIVYVVKLVRQKEIGKIDISKHPRRVALGIISVVLTMLSICPVFSIGEHLLIRLPYTRFMNKLLGIFRSNGRFIWPVMHMVILTVIVVSFKAFKNKYIALALMVIALGVQIFDYKPWIDEKIAKYHEAQRTYRTVWDEIELPTDYNGFFSFEEDNSFMMGTAYYAMRHGMTVNRFYFARDIDSVIDTAAESELNNICDGVVDEKTVYVFDRDTYVQVKDLKEIKANMHFYKTRKCIFGVKEAISGMDEVNETDIDEISWQGSK